MALGGKRPGAGRKKAGHTIEAEAYRAYLVSEVMKNAAPIVAALINKAKKGDVQAIRELHERAMGKVKDEIDLNGKVNLILDVPEETYKTVLARESQRAGVKVSCD